MVTRDIQAALSRNRTLFTCVVALILALGPPHAVSAQPTAVPLPPDLSLEAPGPDVPPELAKFAGVWGNGAWDGVLAHVLVVEQVRPDGEARVVYGYGDAPDWNVSRGHARVSARVEGGALIFDLRGGRVRVEYRFEGDSLRGTYTIGGRVSTVTLTRTTVADLATTPVPPGQVVAGETVRIPLTESGFFGRKRALTLEGTLYRPAAEGSRPVLIFNHGSTGPGAIPATLTLRYTRQAAFFVERGFAVLVPMRRGRGASEGSYAEGYGCESHVLSAGLARAVEDLDAVIAWVRQQPWADAQRIMMGGISRGGILSVVYAAERPDVVRGVINFVGGWTGDGCDRYGNFNEQTFYQAGRRARIPTLWLYAENDRYYTPDSIRRYHKAFVQGGGAAAFHLFPAFGGDGHGLANQLDLWRAPVEDFVGRLGLVPAREPK
jgi:dienelactone hydrolase